MCCFLLASAQVINVVIVARILVRSHLMTSLLELWPPRLLFKADLKHLQQQSKMWIGLNHGVPYCQLKMMNLIWTIAVIDDDCQGIAGISYLYEQARIRSPRFCKFITFRKMLSMPIITIIST